MVCVVHLIFLRWHEMKVEVAFFFFSFRTSKETACLLLPFIYFLRFRCALMVHDVSSCGGVSCCISLSLPHIPSPLFPPLRFPPSLPSCEVLDTSRKKRREKALHYRAAIARFLPTISSFLVFREVDGYALFATLYTTHSHSFCRSILL